MTPSAEKTLRTPSTARLEAFSDGVFAIAITLLVLDLHSPTERGSFAQALADEWPTYLAYLASFLIIGVVWLTHHAGFERIATVDVTLLLLNLGMLLLVSVLPFPTSVLSTAFRDGSHQDQVAAVALYASVSILLTLVWHLVTLHVERTPSLLHDPTDVAAVHRDRVTQLVGFIPPVVGVAVAFISPITALAVQVLTPLLYLGSLVHSARVRPR